MSKINHHDLSLSLRPRERRLKAKDTLWLDSDETQETFHLGASFTLTEVSQEGKHLPFEELKGSGLTRMYKVEKINATRPLTMVYEGEVRPDNGYRVNMILDSSIELSGFGFYFPTIEPQCQMERFTYTLETDLPPTWTVLVPDDRPFDRVPDGERSFSYLDRPVEDIFLCASKCFQVHVYEGMHLVLPRMLQPGEKEAMLKDHSGCTDVLIDVFGPPLTDRGNIGIVSDRGDSAMDWGYERAHFWVIGHAFLKYAVANDFTVMGLKKSLVMHEMIHAYFGVGVLLTNRMAEAVTQYLEVVLTARLHGDDQIVENYFRWYVDRLEKNDRLNTHAMNDLGILDNHYDHWYLKGALAFQNLERHVGRTVLLDALHRLYTANCGTRIDDQAFMKRLGDIIGIPLSDFYRHWFEGKGLNPYFTTA